MANLNKNRQQQQNPLKCEICEKEFKGKNGSKKHFNFVHKLMEEHQCNICQKAFKLKSQLTSHMKIAHENKKYHICDSCKKNIFFHTILEDPH